MFFLDGPYQIRSEAFSLCTVLLLRTRETTDGNLSTLITEDALSVCANQPWAMRFNEIGGGTQSSVVPMQQ
jgi:hypothetical protein